MGTMEDAVSDEFVLELAGKLGLVESKVEDKSKGKEKITEGKKETKKEVVKEEVHTCPLCESELESEVDDDVILEFVENTLGLLQDINESEDEDEEDESELTDEEIEEMTCSDNDSDDDNSEGDDEEESPKLKKDKGKGSKALKKKPTVAGKPNGKFPFRQNNDE